MPINEALRSACLLCDMELKDLLWISGTVNVCTMLYFAAMGLADRLAVFGRETADDKSVVRSLIEKHEDEPWRLPRFCLDVIQSVVLTAVGLTILCDGDVFHQPFRGSFSGLTSAGFALAVGCCIYRIGQDTVLHNHLKHYKVELVHHLVAIAVYSVFLTYRQNALFGALGLICTASVPSVEISRLLNVMLEICEKPTRLLVTYRRNILIGTVLTFVVRLLIPLVFGSFALANSTPLLMSVPVVAFFFTSILFFGSVNIWLCAMSLLAIYRLKKGQENKINANTQCGNCSLTFPIKSPRQGTILAKQNPISRLTPCANINLADGSFLGPSKVINNNLKTNNYEKISMNQALNNSSQSGLSGQLRQSSSSNFTVGSLSSLSSSEMTVLQVEEETDRPRIVRFLVPRPRVAEAEQSRNSSYDDETNDLPSTPNQLTSGTSALNIAVPRAIHDRRESTTLNSDVTTSPLSVVSPSTNLTSSDVIVTPLNSSSASLVTLSSSPPVTPSMPLSVSTTPPTLRDHETPYYVADVNSSAYHATNRHALTDVKNAVMSPGAKCVECSAAGERGRGRPVGRSRRSSLPVMHLKEHIPISTNNLSPMTRIGPMLSCTDTD